MVYLNERINHLSNKYGLNSQYFNPETILFLNLDLEFWTYFHKSETAPWFLSYGSKQTLGVGLLFSIDALTQYIPQIYPQPSTTVYCVGGPNILPFLIFSLNWIFILKIVSWHS